MRSGETSMPEWAKEANVRLEYVTTAGGSAAWEASAIRVRRGRTPQMVLMQAATPQGALRQLRKYIR